MAVLAAAAAAAHCDVCRFSWLSRQHPLLHQLPRCHIASGAAKDIHKINLYIATALVIALAKNSAHMSDLSSPRVSLTQRCGCCQNVVLDVQMH